MVVLLFAQCPAVDVSLCGPLGNLAAAESRYAS